MNPTIDPKLRQHTLTYQEYHDLMAELVTHSSKGRYTESLINYTRMNIIRMERLDKTTKLQGLSNERLASVDRALYWYVLTEPWCGDAAQILPVLEKLQALNPNIVMGMLLRDDHLDLMDQFLTDGTRSIPKVIITDAKTHQVLGTWGPRPFIAHGMMMKGLTTWRAMEEGEEKRLFHRDLYTKLQKWYARDKTTSIQEEFTEVLVKSI
ncbi:MAG: thioredoxin family protein [Bacteroidota bacterium]